MAYLVDANVLLRRDRPSDPHYPVTRSAIEGLVRQAEVLHITSHKNQKSGADPMRLRKGTKHQRAQQQPLPATQVGQTEKRNREESSAIEIEDNKLNY